MKSIIHISFSKIDFNCPHCDKEYDDRDDIYINRINKNKTGITKQLCSCGKKFGITYNYKGYIVSFKLERKKLCPQKKKPNVVTQ